MMDSTSNRKILALLRDHQREMIAFLIQLIELESPTGHKNSVDRVGAFLAEELRALGARVETIPQTQAGDHVLARWGKGMGGTLLLCHMDTVWDVGTVAERPVRIENGKLYGPGAEDMKGGIAIGLWSIRRCANWAFPQSLSPYCSLLTKKLAV